MIQQKALFIMVAFQRELILVQQIHLWYLYLIQVTPQNLFHLIHKNTYTMFTRAQEILDL